MSKTWDLDASDSNRDASKSSRQNTNPVGQYTTHIPISHPGYVPLSTTPTLPMTFQTSIPQDYLQRQPPVQLNIPSGPYQVVPQVIIIKHSHRRHRDDRHRSHSRSSRPTTVQQSVSYSNPHSQLNYTITEPPQQQYSSSHRTDDFGDHTHPDVPQPHSASYAPATAKDSDPHSGGDFLHSNCTGRRKALCIGINYHGQSHELRGCVNDAFNVRKWLMKCQKFRNEDVVLLTDDTNEPRHLPTRQNLINAMKWLVRSAKPHDSLFFHYSGHGGQVKDTNNDEVDGFDEVIFPLDFKEVGQIVDDELHEIMVSQLPQGCRLTAIFDSCHSGTVLDLAYAYSPEGRLKDERIRGPSKQKKETCADVISWSACKDGQTSADTFQDGTAVGAMSNAFVSNLRERPDQSYLELLRSVRLILEPKYHQVPQLGASHPMDMNRKFFV